MLTALALLALAGRASAQGLATGTVPDRLSFQGYMADANGIPLGSNAPVNLPVVFRIFPSATGGTTNWSERQVVTFDKGNYSVVLGQGAAVGSEPRPNLSDVVISAAGNLLYVETTVTLNGSDEKILPRLRLLPTPYAFLTTRALRADSTLRADSAVRADSATTAGTATNAQTATFAVRASLATNAQTATTAQTAQTVLSVDGSTIVNGTIPEGKLDTAALAKLTGPIADIRLSNNVARRNTANTFTGNQTINGNLTVTNTLSVGTLGQYKVAAGEESLRIVRGQARVMGTTEANADWEAARGTGWTVNRIALPTPTTPRSGFQGSIAAEITFNPPFADVPVVTASIVGVGALPASFNPWGDVFFVARVEQVTRTNAIITTMHSANGWWNIVGPFSFIAVGPR